ncbi:UDP-N-acetylmuramoyl-L-alanine--D-glutamate ligase [Defluviitalea phaphyphila]|uniref:UDP-N-acetylmuramoyl-L-alanine--D-glutamate ligase n=1 Tax=Defluviitalea phaphyphila TaxID=1473580 RepID=UPI0007311D5D|nr:UDP-N-acetylmuramoyl-L-alanine--D-glutamate ligase [Defluviitalea phaphyphila]
MEWQRKNILIIGMAKSGVSAAKLCSSLGAKVTIQDIKSKETLMQTMKNEIEILEKLNIKLILGSDVNDIIDDQDLIILSPGVPTDLDFLQKARNNHIPIWSEIELGYVLCPCPIIAITGTNGKTTTTTLVGEIMKKYNTNTYVVGNIGTPFTAKVKKMNKESLVVSEISSFQLETIHNFKPKVSAVLNITPDHLNRHKTYENYIAAKERIFENQDEQDILVLNEDDNICRKMKKKAKAQIFPFSRKKELEQGAFLIKDKIWVKWGKINAEVCSVRDLQILGDHNIENTLAAVAISVSMKVPFNIIKEVLTNFKGVEHRIEYVDTIDGVKYYNDSKATNVDAAIIGIKAMKSPIILIGGGMDKGADFSDWIDMFFGKVKTLIVIGETSDKIIRTAKEKGFYNIKKASSLKEAVVFAKQLAVSGDCVLLSPACASWDMFKSYEERGRVFKEAIYDLKG